MPPDLPSQMDLYTTHKGEKKYIYEFYVITLLIIHTFEGERIQLEDTLVVCDVPSYLITQFHTLMN